MKINFLVTYYNQKAYVEDSLNSIFKLKVPCDFNVLIGDDGSTDGTGDEIAKYKEKYPEKIKYFYTENKKKSIGNASRNRLNLLKHADGDFIVFLDGDDFFCSEEFILEALEVFNNDKTIETCMFNFERIYSNGTVEKASQVMKQGIVKVEDYISNAYYTPFAACVFKNIFDKEKIEFLERINNFDDNAITIYFLQFGNLYYIDEVIYAYRQSEDSLWNSLSECEQNVVNALDYKLISITAPSLEKYIGKRYFNSIKYLYHKRKTMGLELNNKLDVYIKHCKVANDAFVKNILIWNSLNIFYKLFLIIKWKIFKNQIKLN